MKIMSLYAHPADHFAEAGGTLAIHAERGDEIVLVTLTHGARIHPVKYRSGAGTEDTRQAIIEAKREEMRRAAECIGVKRMIDLDFDDNYIGIQPEMVMKLAEVLAEECPDIVITDYPLNPMDADTHTVASVMFFNAVNQVGMFLENMNDNETLKTKEKKNFKNVLVLKKKSKIFLDNPCLFVMIIKLAFNAQAYPCSHRGVWAIRPKGGAMKWLRLPATTKSFTSWTLH